MAIYEIEIDGKTYEVEAESPDALDTVAAEIRGSSSTAPVNAPPERGSPEFEARMQELQSGVDTAQTQSDAAQSKIDTLDPILMGANMVQRGANSATFGVPDRLFALGQTAVDRVTGGQSESRFRELKDMKEGLRQEYPKTSLAGDIGGALAGGGALIKGGVTATRAVPSGMKGIKGLGATTGAMAADGAAYNALSALGEGKDVGKALVAGGLFGGGANLATRGLARPIGGLMNTIRNPAANAKNKIVSAFERSGLSRNELADKFRTARADGASEFILADALGDEGARLASGVVRQQGRGGAELKDFLNARQYGQADRVINALDDGFATGGKTAQETVEGITQNLRATDAANYAKIPNDVVSPTSALSFIDANIKSLTSGLTGTKLEKSLAAYGKMIRSGRATSVDAQRLISIRQDVDDAAQAAFRSGNGKMSVKLKELKTLIDDDISKVSSAYREANAASSKIRGVRDAVTDGQKAYTARPADVSRQVNALSPEGRGAFSAGFGDRAAATAERGRITANAAGPFTSPRFQQSARTAAAGDSDQMLRRLGRENVMSSTRARATGGSLTADNLADQANVNAAVTVGGKLVRGDLKGVVIDIVRGGVNALTGQNQASRDELARLLMANSDSVLAQSTARSIINGEQLTQAQQALLLTFAGATG